jgi:23S rRNA pseudouridine1911/1915/1917 synthase
VINRVEITAANEHNKMRLEDFLLDHFSGLSKMYLRDLVKIADCEVNGRHENIGFRLKPNDFIEIVVDSTRGTSMRPEEIVLDIVFEDEELIVVNKPAGMLVHPSHRENSGTLLNALSFYLNRDREEEKRRRGEEERDWATNASLPRLPFSPTSVVRPGLPHRLDKQTSGLMVVAKTARAHRRLSDSFMKKRVEKRYLALVEGVVKSDAGTIEAPIGRFDELKLWGVKEDGKLSESRYTVRKRFADSTLVELEPVTGRTNQLRIHCEMIGHPIIGDTMRGGREFMRLCLHASRLAFPHPKTNEFVGFEVTAPSEFSLING